MHDLSLTHTKTKNTVEILEDIKQKISSITPVTDTSKALGRDFRRAEILARWTELLASNKPEQHTIATFSCIASSGTYMRTLAEEIAKAAGTTGLAYSIHRTHLGRYQPLPFGFGVWQKRF